MNTKYIIIVVVVGLAALGWFTFSSQQEKAPIEEFVVVEEDVEDTGLVIDPSPELAQEEEVVEEPAPFIPDVAEVEEQEAVLSADASIEERFEFTLNAMLRDVAAKTQEYQKIRKVMQELAHPDSFADPQYIEENFLLFQEVVPQLYEKSSEILRAFENADSEIKTLASEKSEEARAVILQQWQKLKQEQAGAYQKFFELEGDVIQAHDRLMRFYYTKREFYAVSAETGQIEFLRENDERLARKLHLQLNRMNRAQDNMLQSK